MKIILFFLFIFFSISIYSKNSISFVSDLNYMKTFKGADYFDINNGFETTWNFKRDYYLSASFYGDSDFNKIAKIKLELMWRYEFYFFDIHPFISYYGGYLFLNEGKNIDNLFFAGLRGGVLYHAYNFWKRLKIGVRNSVSVLAGTNKYFAVEISGIFFLRIEF